MTTPLFWPEPEDGEDAGESDPVMDADVVRFLQWALPRMRMRWSGFRRVRRQVRRRLAQRLRELGLDDLDRYRDHLETHPGEWTVLDGLCQITISRFYRDGAVFDALRAHGLPALGQTAAARDPRTIRAWSAGCGSGEEPYSLSLAWALSARRQAPGVSLDIVATDASTTMLDRARRACYPLGALKELPSGWTAEGFERSDDGYCLRDGFRAPVRLLQQDVREEMPAGPFELILCRNLVFTYFERSLQATLLTRMLDRLMPGGFLVLGGHESFPEGSWPVEAAYGTLPVFRSAYAPGP